jgi:CBS domain containing-hemolysin-like protein
LALLLAALLGFVLVVAAEAGVIAGFRARMQAAEKEKPRLDVLRHYSRERQVTLASLTLARNLTLVAMTAIVVFLILEAAGRGWWAVTLAAFATLMGLMLFQALSRLLVSQNPERWSAGLRPFVDVVRALFGLPARLMEVPVVAALRLWQARRGEAAREAEDLLRVVTLETATGVLPEAELEMIRGIIEMGETTVREVMIPRIDMVTIAAGASFDEVTRLIVEKGFSRLPVYEETIDNIIGVVHAKGVLRYLVKGTSPASLHDIVRPAHFVPESKRVGELLAEMRQQKMSIAIVVDEYGGTAGLVTLEDLLEEIVGEIADEFDVEEPQVQRLSDSEAIVDARLSIDTLNEVFQAEIEKDDFETVGGFIYDHLGKMPNVGDEVEVDGLRLRVLAMLGRRIKKVRVSREPAAVLDNGASSRGGR